MNNARWIFFDLDGTLVDNLKLLYDVYVEFLSDFGIKGNKKEFEKLNGPSINEIIRILKKKYSLNLTNKKLELNYNSKIVRAYKKSQPTKNSTQILKVLKKNGYEIALVTSSPKKLAMILIKKFRWEKLFSKYVFGNEIVHSKPHPQIYRLCLKKTKALKNHTIVIEDSKNGYSSAKSAGLNCMLINKKQQLNNLFKIIDSNV